MCIFFKILCKMNVLHDNLAIVITRINQVKKTWVNKSQKIQ